MTHRGRVVVVGSANAAALAGAHVLFWATVGDDGHGASIRAALVGGGVDDGGLRTAAGRSSGIAVAMVAPLGENAIARSPGMNHSLAPAARLARSVLTGVQVPAPAVEVVGTSGAGDAFVGVAAAELSRGRPLRTAPEAGTMAGAAAVQSHGAQLTRLVPRPPIRAAGGQ